MVRDAFKAIDTALANGELVCIFPEGGLSRDGQLAPFQRGVERIVARRAVTVVALALCGMWSSMWSRRDSLLGRARLPRRFRAPVAIVAAPALAAGTALSARTLENTIRQLLHTNASPDDTQRT